MSHEPAIFVTQLKKQTGLTCLDISKITAMSKHKNHTKPYNIRFQCVLFQKPIPVFHMFDMFRLSFFRKQA